MFIFLTREGVETYQLVSISQFSDNVAFYFFIDLINSPRITLVMFMAINICFTKNIKYFIKSIIFFDHCFFVFSILIISGCGLILLPQILTLIALVILPIIFNSFITLIFVTHIFFHIVIINIHLIFKWLELIFCNASLCF